MPFCDTPAPAKTYLCVKLLCMVFASNLGHISCIQNVNQPWSLVYLKTYKDKTGMFLDEVVRMKCKAR